MVPLNKAPLYKEPCYNYDFDGQSDVAGSKRRM